MRIPYLEKETLINEFKDKAKGNTPFFLKFIMKLAMKSDEILSSNYLLETYNKIVQYKQVIKNEKVNIFTFENFDELNDELDDLIFKHENKKFINKFLSNKYKDLLTKKSFDLFALLRENNVPIELINDRLISGIAALKTSQSFNYQLEKFTNEVTKFSNDHIIKKVENNNSEVVFANEQFLAIMINDFKASQEIGSSRWCISRTESAFSNYKASSKNYSFSEIGKILRKYNLSESNENRYVFLFDFSKNTHSPDYLIGYTLSQSGEVLFKFDANNRVYNKNEHNELLKLIQLNYLQHLNKDLNISKEFEKTLKKITDINDKIIVCNELQPSKLVDLYKKLNLNITNYNEVFIYNKESFDFFVKKSESLFSKKISTRDLFTKFNFVNTELLHECIKDINIEHQELLSIIEGYLDIKNTHHYRSRLTDFQIIKLQYILENFSFNIDNHKVIREFVSNNDIVSLNTFNKMNLSLGVNELDTLVKSSNSISSFAKLLRFESSFTQDMKKHIKSELSKVGTIKSIFSKQNLIVDERLIPYFNLSKCINVLSEIFMTNQVKFLKEKRNQNGVRFYSYNRHFFEILMDNYKKSNIHRFKIENSLNVLTLLLNYKSSEDYMEIFEWAKAKRPEVISRKLFCHNNIIGKTLSNNKVIKFLSYDESLLLPNINQLSYLSLSSKNEKEKALFKLSKLEEFDKSTLHHAFNGVFELNGDKELLDMFLDIFNIDTRKPIVVFKDMLNKPDDFSKEDMLNFIETYHTDLRDFLKQSDVPFLKIMSRYL